MPIGHFLSTRAGVRNRRPTARPQVIRAFLLHSRCAARDCRQSSTIITRFSSGSGGNLLDQRFLPLDITGANSSSS
jgi:hypothetical protein